MFCIPFSMQCHNITPLKGVSITICTDLNELNESCSFNFAYYLKSLPLSNQFFKQRDMCHSMQLGHMHHSWQMGISRGLRKMHILKIIHKINKNNFGILYEIIGPQLFQKYMFFRSKNQVGTYLLLHMFYNISQASPPRPQCTMNATSSMGVWGGGWVAKCKSRKPCESTVSTIFKKYIKIPLLIKTRG